MSAPGGRDGIETVRIERGGNMKRLMQIGLAATLGVGSAVGLAQAQTTNVVKIGQIEAQTGPNAIYGWMSSQGAPIAVDEINKAGGFKVGDTTYKLELIALDTRGDPKEASVQLKRLLEQDKGKFVVGPFLSNVFVTIFAYAKQLSSSSQTRGGVPGFRDYAGGPSNEYIIRPGSWDAGQDDSGGKMVDYRIKKPIPKKVALLFQNDRAGRVLGKFYEPIFKAKG